MASAKALRRGGRKIGAMGRHHHAFTGLEIERLGGGEINARLRLEIAGNLRSQDRVPAQIIAASDIGHDGDVAVRTGAQHQPRSQPGETRPDILPGVFRNPAPETASAAPLCSNWRRPNVVITPSLASFRPTPNGGSYHGGWD